MSEIRIERKGHSYWPWVLLAIALIAAVVVAVAWLREPQPDTVEVIPSASLEPVAPQAAAPPANGAAPGDELAPAAGVAPAGEATRPAAADAQQPAPAVESYLAFAQSPQQMSLSHDYTSSGIRQLADALGALPQAQDAALRDRLDGLRAQADVLQQDPNSLRHADVTRSVFVEAADIVSTMAAAGEGADGDAIEAPKRAAESIRGDRPLTEQGEVVQEFFDASAEAVRALSGAS